MVIQIQHAHSIMSIHNDVKIFDEYHTVARSTALTLEECNDKFSTAFDVTNNSKLAYQAYAQAYEDLKLSENVIEGEWLTTRMSSLMDYLNQFDAIQQKKRNFIVDTHSGVTDIKKLNTRVNTRVTIPMEEAEQEANDLKMEKINLEDAFTTPQEEVENEIQEKKSYGKTFEAALDNYVKESNLDWSNHVAYIPTKEAISNKIITKQLIRKHIFPNKNSVIETIKLWKQTLNMKNNMYDASDLFVINVDNEKVKVASIPYIFKEAEKYYDYKGTNMYKINLIGKRHL